MNNAEQDGLSLRQDWHLLVHLSCMALNQIISARDYLFMWVRLRVSVSAALKGFEIRSIYPQWSWIWAVFCDSSTVWLLPSPPPLILLLSMTNLTWVQDFGEKKKKEKVCLVIEISCICFVLNTTSVKAGTPKVHSNVWVESSYGSGPGMWVTFRWPQGGFSATAGHLLTSGMARPLICPPTAAPCYPVTLYWRHHGAFS